MNMTKRNKKKKTSPVFLGVVVAVMAAVFAAQMLFPTNLGKLFDKQAENAVQISVTVTRDGAAGASYHTASEDHIDAFGKWAAEGKWYWERRCACVRGYFGKLAEEAYCMLY